MFSRWFVGPTHASIRGLTEIEQRSCLLLPMSEYVEVIIENTDPTGNSDTANIAVLVSLPPLTAGLGDPTPYGKPRMSSSEALLPGSGRYSCDISASADL